MEQWAAAGVDTCYRKADQEVGIGSLSQYGRYVRHCIRKGQDVGSARLWRERHVRELVQERTRNGAESPEAWFLEDWDPSACHPSGDINPDVDQEDNPDSTGTDNDCGLFDP